MPLWAVGMLWLWCSWGVAQSPEKELNDGTPLGLEGLIQHAFNNDPALKQLQLESEGVLTQLDGIRSWDPLEISAAVAVQPIETRVGPQRAQLSASQKLPDRKSQQAESEWLGQRAEESLAAIERIKAQRRYAIQTAWIQWWLLSRQRELHSAHLQLLTTAEGAARAGYENGRVTYSDLIRTQVDAAQVEVMIQSLEDAEQTAKRRLNRLAFREPSAPLAEPYAEPVAEVVDEAQLFRWLESHSPGRAQWVAKLETLEAKDAWIDRQQRPRWSTFLSWMPTGSARAAGVSGSGDDPVFLGVKLSLPLDKKRRFAQMETQVTKKAEIEASIQVQREQDLTMLENLMLEWRDARRREELYGEALIPKADQALMATEAAFLRGQGTIRDWTETAVQWLQLTLEREQATYDRHHARYAIEALLGRDPRTEEGK